MKTQRTRKALRTTTVHPTALENQSHATKERAVVEAVLYAMREGCFFPVPEPKPGASVRALIQWGAMRNLHTKVAELCRGQR